MIASDQVDSRGASAFKQGRHCVSLSFSAWTGVYPVPEDLGMMVFSHRLCSEAPLHEALLAGKWSRQYMSANRNESDY